MEERCGRSERLPARHDRDVYLVPTARDSAISNESGGSHIPCSHVRYCATSLLVITEMFQRHQEQSKILSTSTSLDTNDRFSCVSPARPNIPRGRQAAATLTRSTLGLRWTTSFDPSVCATRESAALWLERDMHRHCRSHAFTRRRGQRTSCGEAAAVATR